MGLFLICLSLSKKNPSSTGFFFFCFFVVIVMLGSVQRCHFSSFREETPSYFFNAKPHKTLILDTVKCLQN